MKPPSVSTASPTILLFLFYCSSSSSYLWTAAEAKQPSHSLSHSHSRYPWSLPRGGAHDHDSSESSSSSSILSSIVRQSSKALAATARGSTKLAADLVRPKEVDWGELVGWWRLDIALEGTSNTPPMTVQITRDGRARFADVQNQEYDVAVEFRPASWPRSAKLKFASKEHGLLYECTVQRKLANLEILKLRGKIYSMRRFQGKMQVGTFVGRRRVVILDGEQREEDSEEYDDDSEEELDGNGEGDDSEDFLSDKEEEKSERSHDSDDYSSLDDDESEEE
eukprot:scaffold7174_cov143-Amphora_coffeaeformis.AAC.3